MYGEVGYEGVELGDGGVCGAGGVEGGEGRR